MITRTVKYTDLDGNEVEETLRFHLSKDELRKLDEKYEDGVEGTIVNVLKKKERTRQDNYVVYDVMKELILSAYGVKSEDARHFIKSEEIRKDFETSLAFEAFLDQLIDDGDFDVFLSGVVGSNPESFKASREAILNDPNADPALKMALRNAENKE